MTDTGQGSNRPSTNKLYRALTEMNRSSKRVTKLYNKFYRKQIKALSKFIQYKEISDTIINFHMEKFDKNSQPTSKYTAMLHENLTSWVKGIIVNHELTGKSHRY